jgi:hypothetical protein
MDGVMDGVMGGAKQVRVHNLSGLGYRHVFLLQNFPTVRLFETLTQKRPLKFLCKSTVKLPNAEMRTHYLYSFPRLVVLFRCSILHCFGGKSKPGYHNTMMNT